MPFSINRIDTKNLHFARDPYRLTTSDSFISEGKKFPTDMTQRTYQGEYHHVQPGKIVFFLLTFTHYKILNETYPCRGKNQLSQGKNMNHVC